MTIHEGSVRPSKGYYPPPKIRPASMTLEALEKFRAEGAALEQAYVDRRYEVARNALARRVPKCAMPLF